MLVKLAVMHCAPQITRETKQCICTCRDEWFNVVTWPAWPVISSLNGLIMGEWLRHSRAELLYREFDRLFFWPTINDIIGSGRHTPYTLIFHSSPGALSPSAFLSAGGVLENKLVVSVNILFASGPRLVQCEDVSHEMWTYKLCHSLVQCEQKLRLSVCLPL